MCGYGRRTGALQPEVEMADQSQDPEHTDPEPGEAGFGPGEHGDSIEEGREAAQDEQDGGEDES